MTNNYIFQTYFPLVSDLICFFVWFSMPNKMLTIKKDKRWVITVAIVLNIVFAIVFRSSPFLMTSPLRTLFILVTLTFYLFTTYEETKSQKTIALILWIISMTVADALAVVTMSLMNISLVGTISGLPVHFFSGLLTAFYSYILMFMICIIYNKIRHKRITNKLWQFEVVLISQLLFILTIGYCSFSNDFTIVNMVLRSPVNTILLLLTIIVSIVADICLYRILQTNSQNYELKQELELANLKNDLELQYYEKLKKSYNETRKINHDFSNAIIAIESLVNNNMQQNKSISTEIINDIKDTLSKTRVRYYCENELVNLIVLSKSDDLLKVGVDFSANLNIPNDINIKNFDLCRLFLNILDNAKEASQSVKHKEKTFVVLTVTFNENCLDIMCENYCDTSIKKQDGNIVSTKYNHQGLGLNIIKEIASSYNGETRITYDNNIFSINIKLMTT